MKQKYSKAGFAGLCAGAALSLALLAPCVASAATAAAPGSAANAKILNVVTVSYFDATGTVAHKAATSTSVTVDLKQSPLNIGVQTAFTPVDSGVTAVSRYSFTATANGADSYKVAFGDTPTNLQSSQVTGLLQSDVTGGTSTSYASGDTFTLGATSIVSVAAPSGNTQTLSIPGGALNGIGVGSIVVISDVSYKVTAVQAGSAASYSVTGSSTAEGSLTPEQLGSITIASDDNGSKTVPAFAAGTGLAGTIIGERKYLELDDKSIVSSNTADGTDDVSVSVAPTTNGGSYTTVLSPTPRATYYHVSVSIDKSVRNVTNSAASGTGKPGDVLEYTVTVTNTATGNANYVSITDGVPAYTTLVAGSTYGTNGGGDIFATVNDGSNTVNITMSSTDSETQGSGGSTGFGNAAGSAAGSQLNFFIGTSATNSTGGVVAAGKLYTIKYQVKIN